MALITDLPTQSSPASSDYMITDNGTTTSKSTIENVKKTMGFPSAIDIAIFTLVSGTAKTFTVPNNGRYLVVISSAATTRQAAYIIGTTTAGALAITEIAQGTNITRSSGTNSLTITSTGGNSVMAVFTFGGSPITG